MGKPDAYVVSNRIGAIALKNPTCCDDIWRIQYEPKLAVTGTVVDRKNDHLITQSVVKMVDQNGDAKTYNSEDGKFLFHLSRGHQYVITSDKPGYSSLRATISTMDIKRTDPDDTVTAVVYMDTIVHDFSVHNVYYDYDKATLRPESVGSLDTLVSFMKDNPAVSVEVYSFTDGKGDDKYNKELSSRRAESVVNYLEKNGIDRARMIPKGFGKEMPAAPNTVNKKDNPEGRQLNRRTEFRVVTDVPTKHVIYNSAKKGTMDEQMQNLKVDETMNDNDDKEPADKESEMGKPGSRVNKK